MKSPITAALPSMYTHVSCQVRQSTRPDKVGMRVWWVGEIIGVGG
jgi:hypothetical protein